MQKPHSRKSQNKEDLEHTEGKHQRNRKYIENISQKRKVEFPDSKIKRLANTNTEDIFEYFVFIWKSNDGDMDTERENIPSTDLLLK